MSDDIVAKCAVSVSEMARAVGLSRARFYQLVKRGTFPPPDKESVTGRPCYFEEGQRQVMEVRRRNCGIDGKPVLFYARRRDVGVTKRSAPSTRPKAESGLVAELVGLLAQVKIQMTTAQVESLVKEACPDGTNGKDTGTILDLILGCIRRRNSSGKVG